MYQDALLLHRMVLDSQAEALADAHRRRLLVAARPPAASRTGLFRRLLVAAARLRTRRSVAA